MIELPGRQKKFDSNIYERLDEFLNIATCLYYLILKSVITDKPRDAVLQRQ